MKKQTFAALLLTGAFVAPLTLADNPACEMTVCLSAPNMDDGGEPCRDAMEKFFDIKVKKAGKVDISRTIKKRRDKLDSCEGAEDSDKARIMARYGAMIDPL